MITFLDGPAVGQILLLRHAPEFLRVTYDGSTWDALDLASDCPNSKEAIHVYRRVGEATGFHMRCQRPAPSGWFAKATYERLKSGHPSEKVLRDPAAWSAWVKLARMPRGRE